MSVALQGPPLRSAICCDGFPSDTDVPHAGACEVCTCGFHQAIPVMWMPLHSHTDACRLTLQLQHEEASCTWPLHIHPPQRAAYIHTQHTRTARTFFVQGKLL